MSDMFLLRYVKKYMSRMLGEQRKAGPDVLVLKFYKSDAPNIVTTVARLCSTSSPSLFAASLVDILKLPQKLPAKTKKLVYQIWKRAQFRESWKKHSIPERRT
uniref:Ras-associating domain-containing protein n=1 Tax=Steinernema glaseri TaxID=37863 RepID=A0A1I7YDT3_9BILA